MRNCDVRMHFVTKPGVVLAVFACIPPNGPTLHTRDVSGQFRPQAMYS